MDAATGVITTVAGTGGVGFSADGTEAVSAALNRPAALGFDAAGDLFFAEMGSHRVRRIDHATGVLTTVAGDGVQGFSGDGGAGVKAEIDSPGGLAVDAAGDVFFADTHNQRVRRVDAVTGVITTVAGTGVAGFAGDGTAAGAAELRLPRGLSVDAAGDVLIADLGNHRIRRVDGGTGAMTTVAGNGTQAFAGDGGPAVAASLDGPRAVVSSPAGLPTLADTGNARVRQVDAAGVIHTLAGLGTVSQGVLTLGAPGTVAYGSGRVTATLEASPAVGAVTFFDDSGTLPMLLGTGMLSGNAVSLSLAGLAAGVHALEASYQGDTTHAAAVSSVLAVRIAPDAAVAAPVPVSVVYGQAVPGLTGTLTGILPGDLARVSVEFQSGAVGGAAPGLYGITAALSGPAAGDYVLTTVAAAVTIAKAPVVVTLVSPGTGVYAIHAASTTSGAPGGTVTLLDGTAVVATAQLSAAGDATVSPGLTAGSHTLSAVYGGDSDFLAGSSAPLLVSVGGTAAAATPDFSLAATGETTETVAYGSAAQFSFAETPVNGALSSAIQLSVAGLPVGATASFNPAYLPPSNGAGAFVLTVQTPKSAALRPFWEREGGGLALAGLLPLVLLVDRRGRRRVLVVWVAVVLLAGATGCGDRIHEAAAAADLKGYTVTVTGTATSTSGAVLQHMAVVTLNLE